MYNFDILKDKVHFSAVLDKILKKMPRSIEAARRNGGIPYTTKNNEFVNYHINWWTNGFWPALMLKMYIASGDGSYLEEADRTEKLLDAALENFADIDHDAGFMWLISSGARYALDGNKKSFDRTLFASKMLAARYNPNGFITAWNGRERCGYAIIDCMMNLPLLYWASKVTGDPKYRLMAENHAHTAMKYFVRPDHSCNHIVIFDPLTGEVLETPAGQGFAPGSCWSRGEAWAVYGFALSYIYTGNNEYLEISEHTADYFIKNLPADNIPPCDFRQPADSGLKDCAAAVIAASGMLELAGILNDERSERYYGAAVKILRAVDEKYVDYSENSPAFVTHCTAAWDDIGGHDITMDYADYFFAEAVLKLCGDKNLFWKPDVTGVSGNAE